MRWQCEEQMEIGKWKLENCKERIPAHVAHEWGTLLASLYSP